MKQLNLGCGTSKARKLETSDSQGWHDVVHLDIDPDKEPHVVHDLNCTGMEFFEDESFDEIHAYDVLEHTGTQGDWRFFFDQFAEFWRILKPEGLVYISVPHYTSIWSVGDPGHTRLFSEGTFCFLDSEETNKQIGKTPITDYKFYWKKDFERLLITVDKDSHQIFVILKKRQ